MCRCRRTIDSMSGGGSGAALSTSPSDGRSLPVDSDQAVATGELGRGEAFVREIDYTDYTARAEQRQANALVCALAWQLDVDRCSASPAAAPSGPRCTARPSALRAAEARTRLVQRISKKKASGAPLGRRRSHDVLDASTSMVPAARHRSRWRSTGCGLRGVELERTTDSATCRRCCAFSAIRVTRHAWWSFCRPERARQPAEPTAVLCSSLE